MIVSVAFMSNTAVEPGLNNPEYSHSVENSWTNTQEAYSIRATQRLANITQNNAVDDYEAAAAKLVKNGTYRDGIKQKSNYLNWSDKTVKLSRKIRSSQLRNLNLSSQNLSINTESSFKLSLNDRNRTFRTSGEREVYGVQDPVLKGIETREIDACSFDRLAERINTGSGSNGTARGKVALENIDPQNESERILVTSDVKDYSETQVRDLAGYVSTSTPADPSSYNTAYVVGVPELPTFDSKQRAIIHQGLWKSNFFRTRKGQCYIPTAHTETPSIADRIENKTRGNSEQGIFTLLDPSSGSLDIGYQRANNSGINSIIIAGVSTGKGETWPEFRMGRDLAREIGISELVS